MPKHKKHRVSVKVSIPRAGEFIISIPLERFQVEDGHCKVTKESITEAVDDIVRAKLSVTVMTPAAHKLFKLEGK